MLMLFNFIPFARPFRKMSTNARVKKSGSGHPASENLVHETFFVNKISQMRKADSPLRRKIERDALIEMQLTTSKKIIIIIINDDNNDRSRYPKGNCLKTCLVGEAVSQSGFSVCSPFSLCFSITDVLICRNPVSGRDLLVHFVC